MLKITHLSTGVKPHESIAIWQVTGRPNSSQYSYWLENLESCIFVWLFVCLSRWQHFWYSGFWRCSNYPTLVGLWMIWELSVHFWRTFWGLSEDILRTFWRLFEGLVLRGSWESLGIFGYLVLSRLVLVGLRWSWLILCYLMWSWWILGDGPTLLSNPGGYWVILLGGLCKDFVCTLSGLCRDFVGTLSGLVWTLPGHSPDFLGTFSRL